MWTGSPRNWNMLDDNMGHELEDTLIQRHRNLDTRIGGFDNFHGIFARHERGNANKDEYAWSNTLGFRWEHYNTFSFKLKTICVTLC